jgi:hypothetical protein
MTMYGSINTESLTETLTENGAKTKNKYVQSQLILRARATICKHFHVAIFKTTIGSRHSTEPKYHVAYVFHTVICKTTIGSRHSTESMCHVA